MLRSVLLVGFVLAVQVLLAQPYKVVKIYRPYKWMFGVHWPIIDDDGAKFENLLDYNGSWNALPYPSKITVDRYFKYGWSVEGAASYMEYYPYKRINDTTHIRGINFSFDVNGKYSFYNHYAPRNRWIEPYFTFGLGYTFRDQIVSPHVGTVNLGGGINLWITYRFGIQLASQAKLAVYPTFWNSHDNYLHHSIGLVYRTPWEKGYNSNKKKQHKWTKDQQKFKRKNGH